MPVFIAGCGRSGTSYLRTLVDAHPGVFIPSESLFIVDYLRYEQDLPMPVLRWLLAREPQLLCWFEGELPRRDTVAETLAAIHESEACRAGATVWGQKTPRFVRSRDLLDAAFPGIKWIFVHRDPRAVAASMKASGQHTGCIPLAVRRWRRDNARLMEEAGRFDQDRRALVLDYRELVARRDEVLERVWSYLGLPSVQAEKIDERARPVFFTRSRFPVNTVRDGTRPQRKALEAWRGTLTRDEQAYIERYCFREMRALGYQPELDGHASPSPWSAARLWLGALRDLVILPRYLWYWPEYPAWVLVRKAVFGAGRVCRSARRMFRIPR